MGMLLVLQGKETKNIRGFEVFIDLVPMWKNWKMWVYKSSGLKDSVKSRDGMEILIVNYMFIF